MNEKLLLEQIKNKNNGQEYTKKSLEKFVLGYVKGEVKDQLMTSFIKSIYDHGMSIKGLSDLTDIMMHSGKVLDLSAIPGIKVDKHSTGGVGDKVSIVLAPIVASFNIPVAKMSGRGLGFTGGTIDKLESIKGFNINLTDEEFIKQVKNINLAIIAQSDDLVPADKKIYALRDETNLIDSLPLIASSIMSKKLATGSDAILLDVKFGSAAFMKTKADAQKLAKIMINLGQEMKRDVRAEISSMQTPLGRMIGNKLEIIEAIKALRDNEWAKDLKEVVFSSSATMLMQAKVFSNKEEAFQAIQAKIDSKKIWNKFKTWIKTQGGDLKFLLNDDFWNPKYKREIKATSEGYLQITEAINFGILSMHLGAGRKQKTDVIDYEAGIILNKKTGEQVKKGDILFTLYSCQPIPNNIQEKIEDAYLIVSQPIPYDSKVVSL